MKRITSLILFCAVCSLIAYSQQKTITGKVMSEGGIPIASITIQVLGTAYLLGGTQMMHIKKELVDAGQLSYRDFHDGVIKLNAMPMEMIRVILTDRPLTKEYKTQWRFYDE